MNLQHIRQALTKAAYLCDDCLSIRSNVRPRQTVNSVCNKNGDKIRRHEPNSGVKCSDCQNLRKIKRSLVAAK